MKSILTQLIVLLLLLMAGFALLKKFSGQEEMKELGALRTENETLKSTNQSLTQENEALEQKNEQLKIANQYLKTDCRTARIEVLEQKTSPEAPEKILETKIRFTEFNPVTGAIVAKPAEFTIGGDLIYVDALIVKFDDLLVESADVLKNRSLVSFQRIFGENQSPASGVRIDADGEIPCVYRSGDENEEASALEKEIWKNFWAISNDPERQKQMGIRAIHGEAPSQRLRPGRIYGIDLRASDGLSFKVE